MKIPGLEPLFDDLEKRGDDMQATLARIEALLVQIEINTRPKSGLTPDPFQLYAGE